MTAPWPWCSPRCCADQSIQCRQVKLERASWSSIACLCAKRHVHVDIHLEAWSKILPRARRRLLLLHFMKRLCYIVAGKLQMKRSVVVSFVSYHLLAWVLPDGRKVCVVILAHVVVGSLGVLAGQICLLLFAPVRPRCGNESNQWSRDRTFYYKTAINRGKRRL